MQTTWQLSEEIVLQPIILPVAIIRHPDAPDAARLALAPAPEHLQRRGRAQFWRLQDAAVRACPRHLGPEQV